MLFCLTFLCLLSGAVAYPHSAERDGVSLPQQNDGHSAILSRVGRAASASKRELVGGLLGTIGDLLGLGGSHSSSGTFAGPCSDVIVIFARGTGEPEPIGDRVGPQLEAALRSVLGNRTLSFTGVDYPAQVPGYLESGNLEDSAKMAHILTSAAGQCPSASLVSSGYSQGGQLVHNSAALLAPIVSARIKAAVIFGDPDYALRKPIYGVAASDTYIVCHDADPICLSLGVLGAPLDALFAPEHLNYGLDAPGAAQFIAERV
ncbi:cutinase-domain-containing protein [Mycena belliarum]|uniref:Cutinase n=1 Tax=Mycena belliarum TaxID=1033014 RepID=A0AAD6U5M8_9AGAR|nr:cutinase-domain-containing protein [Mycena belliae]